MRSLHVVLVGCLFLGLVAVAQGADKKEPTNKEKIVGVWEPTKGDSLPKGATIEFTKDGKLKIAIKVEGKTITADGTYTVDGDKLTTVLKDEGKEKKETVKIKKLTDKELVTEDSKGMVDEFKKK